MSIRRERIVEGRLEQLLRDHPGPDPTATGHHDDAIVRGSALTRRAAVRLFESGLQSRLQDLEARRMKDEGKSFYTIGSSGHEANAIFGDLLETDDPALLHYRSAAFLIARARRAGGGETPLFDAMLSFAAAAEDPISGGRHKVLGSRSLWIPPQTSTIASHLPKAVGIAFALARMERLGLDCEVSSDAIVYCSFGDASANHATAQAGFTSAAAAALHRQPCPVIFVCEDNGIGISVRTPPNYIELCFKNRCGIDYFHADSADIPGAYTQAMAAIDHCRRTRNPVFFHLQTIRLMGHAGSDVETVYLSEEQLEATELRDPLLGFADQLLRTGSITKDGLHQMHNQMLDRVHRAGEEAASRRKIETAEEVMAPLELPAPDATTPRRATSEHRKSFFSRLPEDDTRGRHLAFRLAQGLKDLMVAYPEMFVFGEDVAKKGGVYNVTSGLHSAFGTGRVFNTILDETSILGIAQGMAQVGCLPFPEIQYLAYLHNAIDQIRGEASSLQFFSDGQFRNPMVVRIAGYAYQKGFGGHFHNDNSIGALLDIPGLVIASPARGDDAVKMLRTCADAASRHGMVCIFLEPIALYMTKDLHEQGDGEWLCGYPPCDEHVPLGEPRLYSDSGDDDLTIVSWANGLYMSLQARKQLAEVGIRARVLDLRWLAPLPIAAIKQHAAETGRVLVVDECRETGGGPSASILAALAQDDAIRERVVMRRIAGRDTFIPLGGAANLVLLQTEDVVQAARAICQGVVS